MKILVRRMAALGDVILTTPVVRRLRKEFPEDQIYVHTLFPHVFNGNQHIDGVGSNVTDEGFDRVINLDLAYERRPGSHIIEAYMLEAFGNYGYPAGYQQELAYLPNSPLKNGKPYVAVHATRAGWSNRTLPRSTWTAVVDGIQQAGFRPILIGTERDDLPGNHISRCFSTNLAMHAEIIANAVCFVGSDSGLMHVAGATDTPIVGVFTCTFPHLRLPWRQGVLAKDCSAVLPALGCIGCLHERKPPVTTEWCKRKDNACVSMVKADEIIEAVLARIEKARE